MHLIDIRWWVIVIGGHLRNTSDAKTVRGHQILSRSFQKQRMVLLDVKMLSFADVNSSTAVYRAFYQNLFRTSFSLFLDIPAAFIALYECLEFWIFSLKCVFTTSLSSLKGSKNELLISFLAGPKRVRYNTQRRTLLSTVRGWSICKIQSKLFQYILLNQTAHCIAY